MTTNTDDLVKEYTRNGLTWSHTDLLHWASRAASVISALPQRPEGAAVATDDDLYWLGEAELVQGCDLDDEIDRDLARDDPNYFALASSPAAPAPVIPESGTDDRVCKWCGCKTNAKMRRCCDEGYAEDMANSKRPSIVEKDHD